MSPLNAPDQVLKALQRSLIIPAEDFLNRPSKGFRAKLVELGCLLASDSPQISEEQIRRCALAAQVIERIHAGALIVDDIQDGSVIRRNVPTLHLKYGIARALNAGNWLYFSPLTSLKELGLPLEEEVQLYRDCLETLTNAHCGQALDIGIKIDELKQSDVLELCLSALAWKTGELLGLALQLGAYAASASPLVRNKLHELGRSLGVGLQMLDDAGNFAMDKTDPMAQKRHEDLYLRRPSWIWAFAASSFSELEYSVFLEAVASLPQEELLNQWLERNDFVSRAREAARIHLDSSLSQFEDEFPTHQKALEELKKFIKNLENAYG